DPRQPAMYALGHFTDLAGVDLEQAQSAEAGLVAQEGDVPGVGRPRERALPRPPRRCAVLGVLLQQRPGRPRVAVALGQPEVEPSLGIAETIQAAGRREPGL